MSNSMVKRAMQARGYSREWVTPKGEDKAFPRRVLDPDSEPIADTWGQAAVRASALAKVKQP